MILRNTLFYAAVLAASGATAGGDPPLQAAGQLPDAAFVTQARELLGAPCATAERYQDEADGARPDGVFLSEADDRTLRVIRTAEQHCEQGNWSDAIAAFQILIDERVTYDVYAGNGVFIPADEYCRRRLLMLPEEAARMYRTLHDTAAGELFRSALRQRSPKMLAGLADTYPVSSYSARALVEAADLHLERGDFPAAVGMIRKLFSRVQPGSPAGFPPALALVKAAACMRASGRSDRSDALLALARSAAAKSPDQTRVDAAAKIVAGMPAEHPDAPRAKGSAGKVALPGRLRWHHQKVDESKDQRRNSGPVAQRSAVPRMLCEPAAHDGILYYRTETTVFARDLFRGTELWTYNEPLHDRTGRTTLTMPYYGRGGGSLFITHASGRLYANMFHVAYDNNRLNYRYKLVALDAKPADGRPTLIWERGGPDDPDRLLRELSFASAPLVVGNRLYVGAMQVPGDELYLCAFNADTGDLLWKAFVCIGHSPWNYIARYGNGAAEVPVEKDGTVYLATNVGLIAAVDGATGRVAWKTAYGKTGATAMPYYASQYRPNNPPVISGDNLFVLPPDGNQLYAFDSGSGRVRWKFPLGNEYHYLLGAQDGNVIISGNRITCLADDGTERWSNPLTGEPCGRGLLAEGFALCPTDEGIEAVRLQTGRFVGVNRPYASWQEWLSLQDSLRDVVKSGNLLVTEGKLAVATDSSILVFDERVNPEEIIIALQATPDDPALHAQLASHYLWQEKYVKAADEYEVAWRLLQQKGGDERLADTILGDLFTVYMDLGDAAVAAGGHAGAIDYFGRALDRAPHLDGRLQARVRVAEAQARLGSIREAIDGLQQIITGYTDTHFHPSTYLYVQARAYAEARIAELIKQHGRKHYAHLDAAARQALEAAGGGFAAAQRVIQDFPNSSAIAPCLMMLAENAVNNDDFRTAAGHLAMLLRQAPESAQADKARALLAQCLQVQGIGADAGSAEFTLLPPLESRWTAKIDAGANHAELIDLPQLRPDINDLFYTVVGKNIYCRRTADGTLAWSNSAGWLGVSLRDTPQAGGTEIVEVMPETPALRAGLLPGDVIIGFDGIDITDTPQLIRVCGNTPAGRKVPVKVLRNGQEQALQAELAERPAQHDQMDRGYRAYCVGTGSVNGADRDAVVISRDRFLQALDPISGDIFSRFPVGSGRFSPYGVSDPTPRDGMAVVGGRRLLTFTQGPGNVAFNVRLQDDDVQNEADLRDLSTGETIWQHRLDLRPASDPHIVGDVAVIVETDGASDTYLTCYSIATGEILSREGPLRAHGNVLDIIDLAGGRLAVAIGRDIFCYEIRADGATADSQIWKRHVGGAEVFEFRLLRAAHKLGRELLLVATGDVGIDVIDAASGRSLWSMAPRGGAVLDEIKADSESIYVCSRFLDRKRALIEAFDIETGRSQWQAGVDNLPHGTALLVTSSHLAVALNQSEPAAVKAGEARLLLLDKSNGETVQELTFADTTIYDLRIVGGVLIMIAQDRIEGFAPRRPRT